ncbi:phosphate/phosphite/phosphonate ABC transporter substrate-binding protein [Pseudocolwellia sp. HL-MZ19]|uniref:phosphate/phosphite/phosphonate ABC transporter substrate-binding protein n=1 Tax=Pseudocolwellia sp. HL-MZ19 TaxID=3400846 RepID=UPI003CF85A17
MYKVMFFLGLLISLPFGVQAQENTLTFGVVPQQSAKRLAALWTPVLQHISQETGINIVFSTAKDIPTFEKRLKSGEYDIAYMNPYHYVVFNKTTGYNAIAKQTDKTIKGVIVARANGDIKTINDLEGSRLAFPAPASFAATILPQAELNKLGITFTSMYVSSHDSVYLNVSKGFFLAGGGIERTLNNMPEEIKSTLTTIWQSKEYTSHAIATHPRVDNAYREKILASLMNMNDTEEGMALLKHINFKGFEAAVNKDWDDVRSLHIKTQISINQEKE